MAGAKKKQFRVAADLAAVYGISPGTSYECCVGLYLNASRHYLRGVLATAHGMSVALGNKPLPAELFDGVAETAEQAEDLAFEANAERALEAARSALRAGRMPWQTT